MAEKLSNWQATLLAFLVLFGGWSLGGDIVDCWRGHCAPWFYVRLAASLVAAVLWDYYRLRVERNG